jgi:hypothetical protein
MIAYSSKVWKKEKRMRAAMAAILAMTAPAAMADDLDDSHRLALSGRDALAPADIVNAFIEHKAAAR